MLLFFSLYIVNTNRLKFALKASGIHFLGSVFLVVATAILIFLVWFPAPLGKLAGGLTLFGILIAVDLICGPILTAILSNPAKKNKEQWLDWSLVVLVQLAALGYGLYSIGSARPVAVVFEVDRFVAVAEADVDTNSMTQADPKYQKLSWTGPIWVGVREPHNSDERVESIDKSIAGIEPSVRPNWWQDLEKNQANIQERAKPLAPVVSRLDSVTQSAVLEAADKTKLSVDELSYLPLVSNKQLDSWVVLLNKQGKVVGYAPMSGFEN